MGLVALLQAAQDGDGVLDARLADEDLLEASLEGGVLLDVLAVLVEGRRADEAQLAAGEQRLEHVARVHGALAGGAGTDHRVQLVDEGDDLAAGVLDLLENGLQPLLELAAVLRPGDHGAEVEADDPLVAQRLRHIAIDDALGESSTTAVFPTPGSPMRTGLFLVRRDSTCTTRRISASRPITGSRACRRGRPR